MTKLFLTCSQSHQSPQYEKILTFCSHQWVTAGNYFSYRSFAHVHFSFFIKEVGHSLMFSPNPFLIKFLVSPWMWCITPFLVNTMRCPHIWRVRLISVRYSTCLWWQNASNRFRTLITEAWGSSPTGGSGFQPHHILWLMYYTFCL